MLGFVYLTTRKATGEWYIGKRCGDPYTRANIGYLGSGIVIKAAVKKHGKDAFTREVLYLGPEFGEREAEYLTELNAASDRMSYNLTNYTMGPSTAAASLTISEKARAQWQDPEVRARTQASMAAAPRGPSWNKGMSGNTTYNATIAGGMQRWVESQTEDERASYLQKLASASTGRIKSAETCAKLSASQKGNPKTAEHRAKISAGKKGIKSSRADCPHCHKNVAVNILGQFHGDKCKLAPPHAV